MSVDYASSIEGLINSKAYHTVYTRVSCSIRSIGQYFVGTLRSSHMGVSNASIMLDLDLDRSSDRSIQFVLCFKFLTRAHIDCSWLVVVVVQRHMKHGAVGRIHKKLYVAQISDFDMCHVLCLVKLPRWSMHSEYQQQLHAFRTFIASHHSYCLSEEFACLLEPADVHPGPADREPALRSSNLHQGSVSHLALHVQAPQHH